MSHFQIIFFSFLLISLVLLAAFFSCAETALMAVNRYRLRHKARMKKRYAIHLLQLLKRPDRLLGAILIGSTFANVLASSLATLIAFHFWGDNGALLAAFLLTFVILIFAEITPKTLAAIYPDRVSRWVLYPIHLVLKLLYPMVWFANTISNGFLRCMHIRVGTHSVEPLSREELRSVVYDTTGKISRQYQNMLLSILDLSKLTVDDVMIPRHEIMGIDIEQPWEKMVEQINRIHHEGAPVYRGNVDQLVGVLYVRSVLQPLLAQNTMDNEVLQQLIQPPYFVPEGTPLNIQLAYFQQSHHKMAFVVDEYGEIQGMLTLNDILEEIVGDFTSSVSAGKRIELQPDGSYLTEGTVTVREFNRATEWDLPLRGPRTLNGLIVEYLETLPRSGTAVLIADHPIEIVQVKENRVKLARIFPKRV
ncbi:HlyC/CorC family transporter [Aquicella lusitana]|uniref:Mg2+/Co2+ transporter CorB n=1 Tax=Aquicella lusitana TaxID=254246 RepID=A0A370GM84_9COXI|nr:HlyC/CorC family transporter [Aquicella lusitana]RDI44835.1 Mg2+/Co2+ transporter CorB [Aquicella lusitana]VVC73032.1 Hemolysin C [Aquicella lusitana]